MQPDRAWPRVVATCVMPAALLCALAGCASLGEPAVPLVSSSPTGESLAALQASAHLELLQRLVQGSPAEQAEVLASTRSAYEAGAGGGARLRYGLVLACPAHPARDLQLAQAVLRESL